MESISNILFSLYRGTSRHEDWVLACVQGAWSGLMGTRIGESCRPVAFKRSVLRVEVTDESWRRTLEEMRESLAQRIRSGTHGEVHDLTFLERPTLRP